MINFCFDQVIDPGHKLVRPNLANIPMMLTKDELTEIRGSLSNQFPYCDYPRLLDYARDLGIKFSVSDIDSALPGSFYFVNINQYIDNFDYFELLTDNVRHLLQQGKINILFYYCEADLPSRLDADFKFLCHKYKIDHGQLHFISHNTQADNLPNWYYFNDDEILYQRTCLEFLQDQIQPWSDQKKAYKTTCLIRTHKNWRAIFAGQIYNDGWADENIFSYCAQDHEDSQDLLECPYKPELNKLQPTNVHDIDNTWLTDAQNFLKLTPITVDTHNNNIRNLYRTFVPDFFYNSYWNIVVETHIDIENQSGVFITEKTWKPIAHLQPFIIMGCAGSLKHLTQMGYKTFGTYIDESYDQCTDHIKRTYQVIDLVKWIGSRTQQQLWDLNRQLQPIVEHNRLHFMSPKYNNIFTLFSKILDNSSLSGTC